jgi:uncharacterized membrane protein
MTPITWPYIHITINHFPIVLSTMGLVAAVFAVIRKKRGIWLYTMATMTVAGLSVYPTYLSGDKADEFLHDPWYITTATIDAHNASANWALAVLLLTGAICAYSWWRALRYRDEPIPRFIRTLVFLSTLLSFAVVSRTAYLGGKIIHEAPVLSLPAAPAGYVAPQPQP